MAGEVGRPQLHRLPQIVSQGPASVQPRHAVTVKQEAQLLEQRCSADSSTAPHRASQQLDTSAAQLPASSDSCVTITSTRPQLPPGVTGSKLFTSLTQQQPAHSRAEATPPAPQAAPAPGSSAVQITVHRGGGGGDTNTFPRPASGLYSRGPPPAPSLHQPGVSVASIKTEPSPGLQIIPKLHPAPAPHPAYKASAHSPSGAASPLHSAAKPPGASFESFPSAGPQAAAASAEESRRLQHLQQITAMQHLIAKKQAQQYSDIARTAAQPFPPFLHRFPVSTLAQPSPGPGHQTQPFRGALPFPAVPGYSPLLSPGPAAVSRSPLLSPAPGPGHSTSPKKHEKPSSSSGPPGTRVFLGEAGGVRTMVWSPPPGSAAAPPPGHASPHTFGLPDTTAGPGHPHRHSVDSEQELQAVEGLVGLGQASPRPAPGHAPGPPPPMFTSLPGLTSEISRLQPLPQSSSSRDRASIDMAELWKVSWCWCCVNVVLVPMINCPSRAPEDD